MELPFARFRQAGCLVIFVGSAIAGEEAVQLEKIEITASPYQAHSDPGLAQPAEILSGDQLMTRTQSTLGETVERELGVTASDFNPIGASRPVIRGLGGQRVMILENGASALDVSDISVDHAVSIEPVLARQIEVLRGPSTLLYGSGAVGGVVNVVNDRIPDSLPEKIEGAFESRFNSASRERTGAFTVTGDAGDFAYHADGMYLKTDDYDAAIGRIANSAVEIGQGAIGGSYFGNFGWLGASVSQLYNRYQIPVGPGVTEAPFIVQRQTRLNLKSQIDEPVPGFNALNFDFAWGNYHHTEFENPGEAGTRFANRSYIANLQLRHTPWHSWDGAFGAQYLSRDISATGEEALFPRVRASAIAGFWVEERDRGALHVDLGSRVEYKTYRPEEGLPNRDFLPYTLNVGGGWSFSKDYKLSLNLSRAQRAPQVQELYANGRHVATQTFEIGDPGLKVETSNNIDLRIAKTEGRWQWNLNGFYNFYEDFIFLQEIDSDGDGRADRVDNAGMLQPDGFFVLVQDRQQDAQFYGFEAESIFSIPSGRHGDLKLRLWSDLVRAEFTRGGNVPRMPPWRIGTSLDYTIG
ncbi:MAG: TonB-dependent receptor, partial [Gammaproteobacteria bacterium]